jgi:hypothetical protein
MIPRAEVDDWARRFGVSAAQIERDHFISHVLAAVASFSPEVHFFGGTALCRTYLDVSRLSEDIDLLDREPRPALEALVTMLSSALRREFPGTASTPLPREGDGHAALLTPPGLAPIKLFVGRDGPDTRAWKFVPTPVQLRYSDLAPTQLMSCPTLATFAVMKLAAWFDRHAPRDLFDLAGLSRSGALSDPEVSDLLRRQSGVGIVKVEFERAPRATSEAWETELGAQVADLPEIEACLREVRTALAGEP